MNTNFNFVKILKFQNITINDKNINNVLLKISNDYVKKVYKTLEEINLKKSKLYEFRNNLYIMKKYKFLNDTYLYDYIINKLEN